MRYIFSKQVAIAAASIKSLQAEPPPIAAITVAISIALTARKRIIAVFQQRLISDRQR